MGPRKIESVREEGSRMELDDTDHSILELLRSDGQIGRAHV